MSFINMALKDVKEAEVVPEGEYELRVNSAEVVESKGKKGGNNIKAIILVESAEFPRAMPITHFMSLPNENDEEKTVDFKMLQIKRFLKCFGVPFEDNGFDVEDFAGAQGKSLVVQQEMTKEDGKGGRIPMVPPQFANALHLPRLIDEEEAEKPKGRAAGRRR